MGTVFELNRHHKYDLPSAQKILPLVYKITSEVDGEFQNLQHRINQAKSTAGNEKVTELELSAQALIDRWESKIRKLGMEPKGVWLVDIDAGNGFFCWKYPEMEIKFWHGYEDGFPGRKPIEV
jgi:hypothetical protein